MPRLSCAGLSRKSLRFPCLSFYSLGIKQKSIYWELPWWPTGKNPPANTVDTGSIPRQGTRSHTTPNNVASALQLLSPHTLEPELCNRRRYRSRSLCNEDRGN